MILEPLDIPLDISASVVKLFSDKFVIIGDFKCRVRVYSIATGQLVQDVYDNDGESSVSRAGTAVTYISFTVN